MPFIVKPELIYFRLEDDLVEEWVDDVKNGKLLFSNIQSDHNIDKINEILQGDIELASELIEGVTTQCKEDTDSFMKQLIEIYEQL